MLNTSVNTTQLDFLLKQTDKKLVKLGKSAINKLLETSLLSIAEKIEVLELHLGFRFLTEVDTHIKYSETNTEGYLVPDTESIDTLLEFLGNELNLPVSVSSKKSERKKKVITQVNIFASEALKNYFQEFEKEITSMEIGMLYGYHPKAILAFGGYIESLESNEIKYAYQFFNSKVYPKDFYTEVDEYEKGKWVVLKVAFPEFIKSVEEEFMRQNHTPVS